jgi:hypothetical protein
MSWAAERAATIHGHGGGSVSLDEDKQLMIAAAKVEEPHHPWRGVFDDNRLRERNGFNSRGLMTLDNNMHTTLACDGGRKSLSSAPGSGGKYFKRSSY